MKVKPRFLLHRSHKHLGGREWWYATNELRGVDDSTSELVELIGVVTSPSNQPPEMRYDQDEFERSVVDVAEEVEWFDSPVVLNTP